jgi:HSP20 family protein
MLTGWRDFNEALRTIDFLNRHIDYVFDDRAVAGRSLDRAAVAAARRTAWPGVNAVETKEAFVYRVEVPGLAEGDVAVQVEDDALLLRGERKTSAPEGYEVHLRERAPIAFARKLPLPGRVDSQAVTATMKDGILTVTLPKAKDALPRQITVKAL